MKSPKGFPAIEVVPKSSVAVLTFVARMRCIIVGSDCMVACRRLRSKLESKPTATAGPTQGVDGSETSNA
jgi:hypothetical protein